MRKTISGAIALLLVAGGIALAAPAANATGYPPEECVPSEGTPAWTEDVPDIEHPAVGEPTITIDNPDYVPAVEYQPATYATEYKFVHKFDIFHLKPKWSEDPNWNAESNPQSKGWIATGETRDGRILTEEVPGSDAIGEPTITVDNPEYVAAWIEVTPDIEHPEVPPVTCEEPEEPVVANLNLTYIEGCPPDETNTWRVRNASAFDVPFTLEYAGQGQVATGTATANADTFVDLPRTTATAILKWGGDGIVNGQKVKASGNDKPADHPECIVIPEEPEPVVVVTEAEVTDCDTDTVTTTTTTTTTGWVYVEQTNTWVPGEPVVTETSSQRPATDEECPAPPVDPEEPVTPEEPEEPVTPTEPNEPSAEAPTDTLASTGGPNLLPYGIGGIVAILAGAAALIRRRITA